MKLSSDSDNKNGHPKPFYRAISCLPIPTGNAEKFAKIMISTDNYFVQNPPSLLNGAFLLFSSGGCLASSTTSSFIFSQCNIWHCGQMATGMLDY